MTGATRAVAEFVVGFALRDAPPEVLDRSKALILDTLAVAIGAVGDPIVAPLDALWRDMDHAGPITVIGRGRTHSAGSAAYYNGALAHALEFDDSTLSPVGHPSCVIVPALLALAEQRGAGGAAFLEAYIVGLETHSRLGQAAASGWTAGDYWLPIGHISLIGAAVACAKLRGLDAEDVEHAIGFAVQACGVLGISNGTQAKPLASGASARSGLEAAAFAACGGVGPGASLERPLGFAEVFLGAGHRLDDALAKLGDPFHVAEVGVAVKRYPSCYATHWGVDAILDLIADDALKPGDIGSVGLVHPPAGAFCDNAAPHDVEEARFSHEYNLAAAVLDGVPSLASFSPERIASAEMQAMLSRITTRNHEAAVQPPEAWAYRVEIATTDGRRLTKAVPRPLGHPRRLMSEADLADKVARCTQDRLAPKTAAALTEAVRSLEDLADIGGLSQPLQAVRAPRASGL